MTTELSKTLAIDTLSPRSRATFIRIVQPMIEGWRETELAEKLGRTPSWVSERLTELKQEVMLQRGIFPPLTEAEDQALRDDIAHHGVLVPVLVDQRLRIIDGRNRVRIAEQLGQPCPYLVIPDLDDDERWELTLAINASRRQLTRQQRRKLVEHELMRNPNRSDRRIAGLCGVSHPTVASIRHELAEAHQAWIAQQLPPAEAPRHPGHPPEQESVETTNTIWARLLKPTPRYDVESSSTLDAVEPRKPRRTDTAGRLQPIARANTPKPPPERVLGEAECPCCGKPLEIRRHQHGYSLHHRQRDVA